MILQKLLEYADLVLKKHLLLSSMLNSTVKVMIIVFRIIWIESLKEQHLFEMEIFYNIKNVFTSYYFWTAVYKYAIWTFFIFI